jgi:hypothetical protein
MWLFEERLKQGKNVCIAIRDIEPDENQPWTAEEVKANVEKEYKVLIEKGRVKVTIVPDIESINYGRGVGYDIIEHVPPPSIEEVSATKIRAKMREDGKL